jgi:hypothetical protein
MKKIIMTKLDMIDLITQVETFITDSQLNFINANDAGQLKPQLEKKEMQAVRGFYKFTMDQLEEARKIQEEK